MACENDKCPECGMHLNGNEECLLCRLQGTKLEQKLLNDLSKALGDISYEQKLKIVECLFKCITQEPHGSFRRLIYERLGFERDAYVPLYHAGGMDITNALIELEENDVT